MIIRENCSLKAYNTFGMDVKARFIAEVDQVEEFIQLLSNPPFSQLPRLILGGGSNVLLTKDVEGVVIVNCIKGMRVVREDDNHVWVRAGAGENWHEVVTWAVDHGWGGIENLSLIPGSAGAGPMQNIGAYGSEIKDAFEELEALEISNLHLRKFNANECRFGYRESFFKHEGKDRFIIVSITLRLNKQPVLNTSYGAIREELVKMGVHSPTVRDVSTAVGNIRRSKLPDPRVTGNAGSFFKNPVVSAKHAGRLKENFKNMPSYPQPDGTVKLAAGWLIEQAGWKGFRRADAGVHPQQALVLVNYGSALGKDILALSEEIRSDIKNKFNVELEREVNLC
ncbi:MAG: UDP-N-acetylmuramate dehydrogenase [Bacteroidia bacterium]|nr:UDP-N-acetylmuramate dehydrogenase [Bacteroidia bacterium]